MQVNQIRREFLEYFQKNGHTVVPSSPLIPHNDPSLMFTTAGMVQFKNYFTGIETPQYSTATSSQKCVRAGGKHNDLENVGYTARHHTFFEMLGNFSFGDYFKEQAIHHAWTLLTNNYGVKKEKLYITVYHTDDEAASIWKKVTGFGDDRIIRISTSDNFWAMGDTGPCGPCSEIYYDNGEHIFGGLPGTKDEDGDRYKEIWNLVFMQYEDVAPGQRQNLPKPSIDTGMGLERIATVLQGKVDNFDIDLFQNLILASKDITKNHEDSVSHRVIADHLRSCSFLMADGVMPSNEGRGYVLRRIMRRAMRHVHHLGAKDIVMHKLVPALIREMGDIYPELKRAEAVISSTFELEETRFRTTLDKGMRILDDASKNINSGGMLDGKTAFKLYDTFGFPLDLTQDILRGKNIKVDVAEFDSEMSEQKARARASWVGSGEKTTDELWYKIHEEVGGTEFLGYAADQAEAKVVAIVKDGAQVSDAKHGEQVILVLNQTPFYGESGGQIGDTGMINHSPVTDTKKFAGSIFAHFVTLKEDIKIGAYVHARVDSARRNKIRSNHSATHLLHKALRDILGAHVTQKGSLVAEGRFRFDFSHAKSLSQDEICAVEKYVNQEIIKNAPSVTELKTPEEAINKGAMALFGEKYGDEVRVVSMNDSIELCGGTHVKATGDIGFFKIVSEEAIASGIRRIEAMTGISALEYAENKEFALRNISQTLKCAESDILNKISQLQEDKKSLEKKISELKLKAAMTNSPEIINKGDNSLVILNVEDIDGGDLRSLLDTLKKKHEKSVIVISSKTEQKASILVSVSNELTSKYNASEIIKTIAPEIGGSGGGKPDMAQAGGTNVSGISAAIARLKEII